ncbi:hypothetical protein NC998_28725, partial [Trichocoleus desertorum GB2-A4]
RLPEQQNHLSSQAWDALGLLDCTTQASVCSDGSCVSPEGFQMGKTAKSLFAQKWEEGWKKPLPQWQAELNIQPVRA